MNGSTKQAAAAQTRSRLLDAAVHTMRGQGLTGLTLDAVAREAHVSKGGLLHHFRSKDALIEALLRQLFADFDQRVQHYFDQEADRSGRWLRAYVRATFDDEPLPLEVITMLLSAITENHALLQIIREDAEHWQQRLLNDGVPPARATVIRQAADASWTDRLIEAELPDQTKRAAVLQELLRLTEV